MVMVSVDLVGDVGCNQDTSPEHLPTNSWTDASNIRFIDSSVWQSLGYAQVYNPPSVVPYHVFPINIAEARYWIYLGSAKAYCVNGSTHTDLSPAGSYTGSANKWTSCVIGGIPIINAGNATDLPQSWDLNLANNFGALTNWPAATYCKSMRAYKNFLVALHVTKGSTVYPFMVKWSHPADPGAVPSSWDHTDATKDAGEIDLSEGQDLIVDGLQLRNSFMIYRENSIWRMDYVGGDYVMSFQKVLGQSGALARNCIVELDGAHCVLTGEDLILHDGNSPKSVLDRTNRRSLFSQIDSSNYKKAFVFKNPYMNEVWVCFPKAGSTYCDKALVWNSRNNTVTYRDLPGISHAMSGLIESGLNTTWDNDTFSWDSDTTAWNQLDFTPDTARVMMSGLSDTKLYLLDAESTFNGTKISGYVERRGLHFDAPEKIKLVKGIRPRIYGDPGTTVTVSIGSATNPYDAPTYTDTTYTIGTSTSCDCLVSGRYIAVKFTSGTAYQWRLDSFDVDVEVQGFW